MKFLSLQAMMMVVKLPFSEEFSTNAHEKAESPSVTSAFLGADLRFLQLLLSEKSTSFSRKPSTKRTILFGFPAIATRAIVIVNFDFFGSSETALFLRGDPGKSRQIGVVVGDRCHRYLHAVDEPYNTQ
ncbi:hypothetical protein Q1695_012888 [Nippostrongylus brasiliensis]|nr:hypothetical protein Q1695_012888 [Nippostrongylus brasiliensis]